MKSEGSFRVENCSKVRYNETKKGGGDMKKIVLLLVCLLFLFCLSSCATVKKEVELSQDRANVLSIEIYNPERAYYEGDISHFLAENEPVAVLQSETFASFLDALCDLKFEKEIVFFPMPMDGGYDYGGYIVAIRYSDGGYDIVAAGGLYSYAIDKDGHERGKYDHSDYCGEVPWANFIEKYIRTDFIEKRLER